MAVKLLANVQGFVSGMKTAQQSASDLATKGLDKVGRHEQSISRLSTTAGAMGLALVGAFAGAAKAAIDWETAWAGVLKTVDGSPAQLDALEESLREMARTMPATHGEIAAVAEAAGQLGVATEDVAAFTETMIQLGATTNLSSEEAATALARISNIMGSASSDVSRMGATIVDLGNNSATTEREIVEMSTRLAAAGRQAGLTEADIFAIASTMTSVGVEAEAGGTAMSKTFIAIADAVREGGDDLETFARVSGMTAEEFQRAFQQDAAGAIGEFVGGMGRMSEAGESTSQVFRDLGLTDQRLMRAILSAGSATGLWADQLDIASNAWDSNSAHIDEFGKRVETAAAQMTIAWNNIKDAAIEFGAVTLPMIGDVAGAVSGLAQKFGELPAPIQGVITALTGTGGLVLLGIAGMGKLAIGINDTRMALKDLGISAKTAGLAVGGITAALGIATFAMMSWAQSVAEAKANAEGYQQTLDDMGNTTEATMDRINNALSVDQNNWLESILGRDPESAIDMAKKFGLSIADLQGYIIGEGSAIDGVNSAFDRYLEQHNSSHRERKIAESEISALRKIIDGEADALTDAEKAALQKAEADEAAGIANEGLGSATGSTTDRIIEQTAAIEDNTEAAREASGQVLSLRDAQRNLEEATDGVQESLDRQIDELAQHYESQGYSADAARRLAEEEVNASDKLDITTQAGRRNQAALDDVADSGWDLIDSMRANGASQEDLQDTMRDTRQRFIDAAESMGMSRREAKDLADQLGLIPENVDADVTVNTEAAERAIDEFVNRSRHMYIQARVLSDPNYSPAHSSSQVARASGGPVTAKQGYWVGENGPEWFTPSATGVITNAAASRSMYGADAMTSPAAPVVNVTTTASENGRPGFHVDQIVAADPNAAARALMREVQYQTMGS